MRFRPKYFNTPALLAVLLTLTMVGAILLGTVVTIHNNPSRTRPTATGTTLPGPTTTTTNNPSVPSVTDPLAVGPAMTDKTTTTTTTTQSPIATTTTTTTAPAQEPAPQPAPAPAPPPKDEPEIVIDIPDIPIVSPTTRNVSNAVDGLL